MEGHPNMIRFGVCELCGEEAELPCITRDLCEECWQIVDEAEYAEEVIREEPPFMINEIVKPGAGEEA